MLIYHRVHIFSIGDAGVPASRHGSFLFSIPEVPAEVVVPWILSQKGEAVPIEPSEIVEAVRKSAQATLDSLAAK